MVEIHVYGKLRRYVGEPRPIRSGVIRLEARPDDTIASLLGQVGIPTDEIQHIFFNAKLLASRSRTASFLGYPQARAALNHWDLGIPVADGDRIGLFGRDMAMLGM